MLLNNILSDTIDMGVESEPQAEKTSNEIDDVDMMPAKNTNDSPENTQSRKASTQKKGIEIQPKVTSRQEARKFIHLQFMRNAGI